MIACQTCVKAASVQKKVYQLLKAFGSSQTRWPGTNDQYIDIALDQHQLMLISLLGEELATYSSLLAILKEMKLEGRR